MTADANDSRAGSGAGEWAPASPTGAQAGAPGHAAGGADEPGGADAAGARARALLARHFWGVLTAVAGPAPYAVPVIYGWDGRAAYVLMLPGRKEQLLRAHPRACLTVIDGTAGESVLLGGRAEWVEELSAKLHAADVVRRQMAGRRAPSVRDAARLVRARILRLVPDELLHRAPAFDLPE